MAYPWTSFVTPAQFDELFAVESEALGHRIPGADVLALLSGDVRPAMVRALDTVKEAGFLMACLTNNVVVTSPEPTPRHAAHRMRVPRRSWYQLETSRCNGHAHHQGG